MFIVAAVVALNPASVTAVVTVGPTNVPTTSPALAVIVDTAMDLRASSMSPPLAKVDTPSMTGRTHQAIGPEAIATTLAIVVIGSSATASIISPTPAVTGATISSTTQSIASPTTPIASPTRSTPPVTTSVTAPAILLTILTTNDILDCSTQR